LKEKRKSNGCNLLEKKKKMAKHEYQSLFEN
jgi:hypothetical protein